MGILALSQTAGAVIAVAGAAIFLLAALYLATRGGWRTPPEEQEPEIPAAMTPGPADADLDTKILERLQGWGLVLALFFAIWIPAYWLNQPSSNQAAQDRLKQESIERGRNITLLANEEVNPGGFECVRCHGAQLQGGEVLFNGEPYPVPPLNNICDITKHPAIKSLDDIIKAIELGRTGTPMPSWSVKPPGTGPMDDQQTNDVVAYLISINMDVPKENNICVNPKAGSPTPPPSGSPIPETSGTPSP